MDDASDDEDDSDDVTPSTSSPKQNRDRVSTTSKTVSSTSASVLEEFFSGVAVHLHGLPTDVMTKYKRYIIAYPFVVVFSF